MNWSPEARFGNSVVMTRTELPPPYALDSSIGGPCIYPLSTAAEREKLAFPEYLDAYSSNSTICGSRHEASS